MVKRVALVALTHASPAPGGHLASVPSVPAAAMSASAAPEEASEMDAGRHCAHAGCGQLDFLPFTCNCCARVFCLEHRAYAAHECTAAAGRDTTVIVCPLCNGGIRWQPGLDADALWARHAQSADCDPSRFAKPRCAAEGARRAAPPPRPHTTTRAS